MDPLERCRDWSCAATEDRIATDDVQRFGKEPGMIPFFQQVMRQQQCERGQPDADPDAGSHSGGGSCEIVPGLKQICMQGRLRSVADVFPYSMAVGTLPRGRELVGQLSRDNAPFQHTLPRE